MANLDITNNDLGEVELEGGKYRDDILRFDAADTFAKGTILARRAVLAAIVAAADAGNTGDGTVTAASVVAGAVVPLVGAYVLRCTEAVVNGGVFRLEDPNGAIIAADLRLTVGAGGATVFEVGGMTFTVTDGATDFAAGDFFTLTTSADGKLVPFAPAGSRGDQLPLAVLTYEVTKTGAGTEPIRALVAGCVNKDRLLIDVDGNGDNITDAHLDQLRAHGIVAQDVKQLSVLDNQ